ncbi:hypothetical protein CHS0354_015948 [Potamilus streckersoni]|uniref:Uncharacterized protein n=1 Tax=Potamilus streckersoni TaxID=2493646 RepID=A0AAE0SYD0_9BIVA|nr:hypothetical protein CHS0354_015948 [Potamilus streckersoni]
MFFPHFEIHLDKSLVFSQFHETCLLFQYYFLTSLALLIIDNPQGHRQTSLTLLIIGKPQGYRQTSLALFIIGKPQGHRQTSLALFIMDKPQGQRQTSLALLIIDKPQGIWGSAFCIQFKRLLQDDKQVDTVELLRQEREELEQELVRELSMQENEDSDTSDTETESEDERPSSRSSSLKSSGSSVSISDVAPVNNKRRSSFWTSMLSSLFETSPLMSTIDGRAAMVHNFMRGLSMHTAYPFSPFTSFDEKKEKLGGRRQSKDKLDGVTESKPLGAKDKRERFRSGFEEKLKASSYFSQRLITNDKIEDEDEESGNLSPIQNH